MPDRRRSADVLALGLAADGPLLVDIATEVLPVQVAEAITRYVTDEKPDAGAGSLATITMPGSVPSTVLLVGLGAGTSRELRIAGVRIGRAVSAGPESRRYCVAIDAPEAPRSQALAEGLVLGGYRYSLASTAQDSLHTIDLVGQLDHAGLSAGDEAADAVGWARDLGNTPANELTPQ
ncbi:MAG: M17 family peptidase N-terminal domain-containing protein, partial [Jatrophihabitantaceae bacterium]